MVATCTAETSRGFGLRLVIIQAEPVSNIANPTLDSDVATRMTMKAELPSRPQGAAALDGVFGSRFNSVVKLSARHPDTIRPLACLRALKVFGKRVRGERGERRRTRGAYRCSLEEHASVRERAPARLEPRIPERPRMDHMRPDFQGRGDVGLTGSGSEADRIVEQGLARADLNQGRRQSIEISVERRKARVFPVHSRRREGLRQRLQIFFLNERIGDAFAHECRPRHREVEPRRQKPETAGQILARTLELSDQGER